MSRLLRSAPRLRIAVARGRLEPRPNLRQLAHGPLADYGPIPPTSPAPVTLDDDGLLDGLPFKPRRAFTLPSTIPTWYAGHMYRAMRSLPLLLARQPPPLIIEARDARLPIASINPAFEDLLKSMEDKAPGNSPASSATDGHDLTLDMHDLRAWRQRRLVVYTKADLIDARLHAPIRSAFRKQEGHEVMFCCSHKDSDVKRIIRWVRDRAATLDRVALAARKEHGKGPPRIGRMPRSTQKQNIQGAFRREDDAKGIRLVILGMPNVGKSSLLNALRRVGAGGKKAASVAPQPGHTRKLSMTVRITRKPKLTQEEKEARHALRHTRKRQKTWMQKKEESDAAKEAARNPPAQEPVVAEDSTEPAIYVYDTPGIMVPFLGTGSRGAEKGVKLAAVAGMKSSLFDSIGLADYLLYRANLQWAWRWQKWKKDQSNEPEPLPVYLTHLPMGRVVTRVSETGDNSENEAFGPTNDINVMLRRLSLRSPGTLSRGGVRDLDSTANFFLERWRTGKMGSSELDTGCYELTPEHRHWTEAGLDARIEAVVNRHFQGAATARLEGAATSARPVLGADHSSRRQMESTDLAELKARHAQYREAELVAGENKRQSDALRFGDRAATTASEEITSMISKRQARLRRKAVEKEIRNHKLRLRGISVPGMLPENRVVKKRFLHGQNPHKKRRSIR